MRPSVAFKEALIELCKKHKLGLVPSFESERSWHDPLYIVPLDEGVLEAMEQHTYAEHELQEVEFAAQEALDKMVAKNQAMGEEIRSR